MHRHNLCVIFLGIYSVKEAKASANVICSSALIYNNTLTLLSFIIPHSLKHCAVEACSLQTVGTAVAAPRFIYEATRGRPEDLAVKGWRRNCTVFV